MDDSPDEARDGHREGREDGCGPVGEPGFDVISMEQVVGLHLQIYIQRGTGILAAGLISIWG